MYRVIREYGPYRVGDFVFPDAALADALTFRKLIELVPEVEPVPAIERAEAKPVETAALERPRRKPAR